MSQSPAGWYPDADGVVRWWDGSQWTEHTQPSAGAQPPTTQPLGAQPGQPSGGQSGQPAQPGQSSGGQPSQGWGQPQSQSQGWGQSQSQGWGQAQSQGQGQGQQGWPGGPASYGMPQPPKKGLGAGLWAAIGGAVLLVAAIAVVLILVLGKGGDDKKDAADNPPSSPAASQSATPDQSTSSAPAAPAPTTSAAPDPGTGGDSDAANAPKNASVQAFCQSFDLTEWESLGGGGGSLTKLRQLQQKMLPVGTPADMPANARRGWEWFAGLSSAADAASMNRDDLSALGYYYGSKCY